MRKGSIRVVGQRNLHLNLPLQSYEKLRSYTDANGCTQPTALAVSIDRYSRLADRPVPATIGACGVIRSDGHPCKEMRMPGYQTCAIHGSEYVFIMATLPMEQQILLDKWSSDYHVTVTYMVALAIMTCL